MQRKRQMVFKSVDGGRIHEQTLDLELFCSLAVDVATEILYESKNQRGWLLMRADLDERIVRN